jgi:hypothetical protein
MFIQLNIGRWAHMLGVVVGALIVLANGGGNPPPPPDMIVVPPLRWRDDAMDDN